jgi:hypothetical protein
MAQPQTFDLARTTFDSWPWMFGKQWDAIVGKAQDGGIQAAAPQVHLLLAWCTVYEDPDAVNKKFEEVQGLTVRDERGRAVPAPEWVKLQNLLFYCVQIAKGNGAWVYNRQPEKREVLTKEALVSNGRALP